MSDYDFKVVEAFIQRYDALSDEAAAVVDDAIMRLLKEHESAWARQGRVGGEFGDSWIVEFRTRDGDMRLYWDYLNDRYIVLLVLIVRQI